MSEAMLYVTEFTMPDGSKRRPLVERVPEIRPPQISPTIGLEGNPEINVSWSCKDRAWAAIWKRLPDREEPVAAALLRCAAEDWIIGEGFHSFEWDYNSDRELVTLSLYGQIEVEGKTHHHCLVAACHAIADQLEIAP